MVSGESASIETCEVELTAFHRSSLSFKWCELVRKHIFPKPESSLAIKCWLTFARGVKDAREKLDALHLPSDPIADHFLQLGGKMVDAFDARVLRAIHGREGNFMERLSKATNALVPDGKLDIISTALWLYPSLYNHFNRAPTSKELFTATQAQWKKPISGRSWRNVQREMKDLLQKPGAPPLREDAELRRRVLRDWERVFRDRSRLNIVADTAHS